MERRGEHRTVDKWLKTASLDILFDASSEEDMVQRIRSLTPDQKKELLDYAREINDLSYGGQRLYHGSPNRDLERFEIQKGRRTMGFMGAPYEVQNKGVFMSDSKPMAHFFGSNRADLPNNYRVYESFANTDNVLDASNPNRLPLNLRKLGLELIGAYEGPKTKLAYRDLWWLLDQDRFIDAIKSMGFNGVKFREGQDNSYGPSVSSMTYLMFNPEDLKMRNLENDKIRDLPTLWQHIKSLKQEIEPPEPPEDVVLPEPDLE